MKLIQLIKKKEHKSKLDGNSKMVKDRISHAN